MLLLIIKKKKIINKFKNNYEIILGDLRDPHTIKKISRKIINNKINIIINNAGMYLK